MVKETLHDDQIVLELINLIILNELLKKHLIYAVKRYIVNFEKSGSIFDYDKPISYIDFRDFLEGEGVDTEEPFKLMQFLFNLELFAVKLYRLCEVDKLSIRDTKLKKLRQVFTHRTSGDILKGKERLVIFGGIRFDFSDFYVSSITDNGRDSEHNEYPYDSYISAILDFSKGTYERGRKAVKTLRDLNGNLVSEIFPDAR